MALGNLLESKVGNLGYTRKVYLNLTQHLNGTTTLRIGFIAHKDGTWVRGVKGKKRKATSEVDPSTEPYPDQPKNIPSSFFPPSHFVPPQDYEALVHGLAELKSDFSSFHEEVCGEFRELHRRHDKILDEVLTRLSSLYSATPSFRSFPPLTAF